MTSSDLWTRDDAERYDDPDDWVNSAEVTGPVARFLAEIADGGPALELAIGTGRIGVPLRELGVPVTGIELSQPMVDVLRRKVTEEEIPVVVGDMASAEAPGAGTYSLVYLVFNTIGNLRTQEEQVACFANAARHLAPGGRFLVEVGCPGCGGSLRAARRPRSTSPQDTSGSTPTTWSPSRRSRTTTPAKPTAASGTGHTTSGSCGPPSST